jgi:hypothetical protein
MRKLIVGLAVLSMGGLYGSQQPVPVDLSNVVMLCTPIITKDPSAQVWADAEAAQHLETSSRLMSNFVLKAVGGYQVCNIYIKAPVVMP